MDIVVDYAAALGYTISRKVVIVEGVTDVRLFDRAARAEFLKTGHQLFGNELCIIPAGDGDAGGTRGVLQQLTTFRNLAKTCLEPSGKQKYRIIALFDNDKAGQQAVRTARDFDTSLLEFKDLFRLWPVMSRPTNLDPEAMQKAFQKDNEVYKGLDWELEDLLPPSFQTAFHEDNPTAQSRISQKGGICHRDYTRDGKARFHQFIKNNAMYSDFNKVIEVIRSLRYYLNLK